MTFINNNNSCLFIVADKLRCLPVGSAAGYKGCYAQFMPTKSTVRYVRHSVDKMA